MDGFFPEANQQASSKPAFLSHIKILLILYANTCL